jgi:nitrogen regulatory protein PII
VRRNVDYGIGNHPGHLTLKKEGDPAMEYEAIVVIVERGKANGVIKKIAEAGAIGATIVYGRGSGEQMFSFFRSLKVESSKEIILIISPADTVDELYKIVVDAAKVREKGKGISFTVPIRNLIGIRGQDDQPDA